MNLILNEQLIQDLRELYDSNEVARRFFDKCGEGKIKPRAYKGRGKATRAVKLSEQASISYRDVIKLFKELGAIGAGTFIEGRRGFASRMVWYFDLRRLGNAAAGIDQEPEENDEDDLATVDAGVNEETNSDNRDLANWISHTFQLRPNSRLSLRLPADFSSKEAERLAGFIQNVPFRE